MFIFSTTYRFSTRLRIATHFAREIHLNLSFPGATHVAKFHGNFDPHAERKAFYTFGNSLVEFPLYKENKLVYNVIRFSI